MSHDHHNHHNHRHHHPPANQGDFSAAFAIAIALNASFVALEFWYGYVAKSTALIADAGHNLSDILGLLLAWGAVILSRRAPDQRYTYGLHSASILAALGNAVFLLVACGGIAWEAVQRVHEPHQVASDTVIWVAATGIVVNGVSAWLFMRGKKKDLNVRGAYLHMMADAAVSFGVVVVGVVMKFTAWYWLDPVISLIIIAVIIGGTWSLLKEATQLALNAVPQSIDIAEVEGFLLQRPGVTAVHDLHIWGVSTTTSALTVHLTMPDGHPGDAVMEDTSQQLKQRYAIEHCTLQIETGQHGHECALAR
jgi:cobalt-zinc-cadmium efflux system protein